jgi:hypothetical protein
VEEGRERGEGRERADIGLYAQFITKFKQVLVMQLQSGGRHVHICSSCTRNPEPDFRFDIC